MRCARSRLVARVKIPVLALLVLASSGLAASEGMIDIKSDYPVAETADRLEHILKDKGMTVFNRIKHSDGAARVGMDLRPTELVIFGNPKVGAPLMQCQQRVALDLPQKALVWEDAESNVWLSYNDPGYLRDRHDIRGCEDVLAKVENALANLLEAAGRRP